MLTGAGARDLNRALGLRRVFAAGAPLARARVSGETVTVPIAPASLEFSFDEGFRRKLAALAVAVAGSGSAAQVGTVPLAFSFADAAGDGNLGLTQGVVGSRSTLHLTQGTVPNQHEATIAFSMSFESELVGTVRETWPSSRSGAPFGETDISPPTIDLATGTIGEPPTPVRLSQYGVGELNEAFGAGVPQQFFAGEPLGTLALSGRLGR